VLTAYQEYFCGSRGRYAVRNFHRHILIYVVKVISTLPRHGEGGVAQKIHTGRPNDLIYKSS